jgi:hypothetical protein
MAKHGNVVPIMYSVITHNVAYLLVQEQSLGEMCVRELALN